jgi:hypothetical protein
MTGIGFGEFVGNAMLLYALINFVIHSLFAWAVDSDARRLRRDGIEPVLVGQFVWALAALIGGPLVATAYWVLHHSRLAATPERPVSGSPIAN